MKKKIYKIIQKCLPYIIIIIVSILITIPLFTLTLSGYNEARIHIGRIIATKEIISNKIFPSFINPKYMLGFGYAINIFYGPLTTYIPILISQIVGGEILALKLFTLITVMLSGMTMYNFLHSVLKNNKFKLTKIFKIRTRNTLIALLGALIYIAAPYKLTDIYARTAVGEYTSFIFIPILFQGIYELFNEEKTNKHYKIAIGAIGLILSHTITTIYVALFASLYILFSVKKLKDKTILKKLVINIVIILAITAFYTIPLIEHKIEGNYTIYNAEAMRATGYNVWETSIGLKDWLALEFGKQEIVNSFGIIIIFSLLLTPTCIKETKRYNQYKEFGLLAMLSLWMCTMIFPWIIMPKVLTIVQFAWRLNGFYIFFISYICSVNIVTMTEMIGDKRKILPTIIIILICICTIMGTKRYLEKYQPQEDIQYENNIKEANTISPSAINREYLPINAIRDLDYMKKRENRTYVLEGIATIQSEEKQNLKSKIIISNVQNATLELPYIYYHGYTVKLNGNKIKTYQSEKGFVCVKVQEDGELVLEYTGTIPEKIGYIISIISLFGVIIYIIVKSQGGNNVKLFTINRKASRSI